MSLTKLCAVAAAKDAKALLASAQWALGAGADMVELRMDHLADPEGAAPRALEALASGGALDGAEVVLSVRTPRDGGIYPGEERERLRLLERLTEAGASWIDLEGDISGECMGILSWRARDRGSRVVISWHLGPDRGLLEAMDQLLGHHQARRASAFKLAIPVEDRRELDAYLHLSDSLPVEEVVHVVLPTGRLSRLGRILAPVTGTGWVYVEEADEGYQGPLGLPRLDEISAAWTRMGLRDAGEGAARSPPPLSPGDAKGDWTLLALLGDPVAHTNSPAVHHAALRALGMRGAYVPYRTAPGDVASALADLASAGAVGCNVTVPLKVEAAEAVDELGGGARRSGAVNTIVFGEGGRTRGENTDSDGVRTVASELLGGGGDLTGLVLGTGGAARGAAVGLHEWGARVLVTGRTPHHMEAMASQLDGLVEAVPPDSLRGLEGEVDLLVQCTSQGMSGAPPEGPLRPVLVMEMVDARAVLDLVYAPGGTDLVRRASGAGRPSCGGERVLLHQAAVAFRHWTGRDAPLAEMEAALRASLGA